MPSTSSEHPTHTDKLFDEHIEIFVGAIFHQAVRIAENRMAVTASRLAC
jgi:hypothetical protein